MIKITVRGMTCGHCERAVTDALGAVPGVDRVISVSREREEAVVEGAAEVALLLAAVREEGFEAE